MLQPFLLPRRRNPNTPINATTPTPGSGTALPDDSTAACEKEALAVDVRSTESIQACSDEIRDR